MHRKKDIEEHVIQKFPYRCPYCEELITYTALHFKVGENEVQCPSCKRTYIKIVSNSFEKEKKQ